MIKEPLLYKIPFKLLDDVHTGRAGLVGAIIKDTASGKILGHVQPTAASIRVLQEFLPSAVFSLLDVVTAVQNEQIKTRLREMNAVLGQVHAFSIANLLVSGIGIGVSVAGFAAVLGKLQGIEKHLNEISQAIHLITEDRRNDEVSTVLARLRANVNRAGDLDYWNEPIAPNAGLPADLEADWNRLIKCFRLIVQDKRWLADRDLNTCYSIISAMRLCSDSLIRVLCFMEELDVAQRTAARLAEDYQLLGEELAIDDLARRTLNHDGDGRLLNTAGGEIDAIEVWQCLVGALRDNAANHASQSIIAQTLANSEASGRQYILEAEKEKQETVLYMPA